MRTLLVGLLLALPLTAVWAADLALGGSFEAGHERYAPPLSNPLFNETPWITTEARPIHFRQKIPNGFLSNGGDIVVTAVELRLAVTERFGIIATKDGYADIDFDAALPDESGFANISLGGKYAVVSDPSKGALVTIGAEYEAPIGNLRTAGIDLQGEGDGFLDLFVSGARTVGNWGLQGNAGVNLAIDGDHDTSMLHISGHADYDLGGVYPLVEINAFIPVRDGDRTPVNFEGVDLVNFGATDPDGVVTGALGVRFTPHRNVVLGLGYERTLSDQEDIFEDRFYVDAVLFLRGG